MKKITYKILAAALLLVMLLPFISVRAAQQPISVTANGQVIHTAVNGQPISITVNGQAIIWNNQVPVQVSGRTFVPFRDLITALGGQAGWHEGHQQASLFYRNIIMVVTMGSTTVQVNGENVRIEHPAFMLNDRAMVPLRFVAETFGYEVGWDVTSSTASLKTPGRFENGRFENGRIELPAVNDLPIIPLPPNVNGPGLIHLPLPVPSPAPSPEPIPSPSPSPSPEPLPSPSPSLSPEPLPSPSPSPSPEPLPSPSPSPSPEPLPSLLPYPAPSPIPPDNNGGSSAANGLARNISSAPILAEDHLNTTLTALFTPLETGTFSYVVQAFSPISAVTHFILPDNRLVVDIHSAVSALEGPFYIHPALPIASIGHSQFSRTPNIVRFVFHLTDAVDFNLSLSTDRHFLMIGFAQNTISEVSVDSDAGVDMVVIRGDTLPSLRFDVDAEYHRLRINIDNAMMQATGGQLDNGMFVSHYITGNRADGSAYVYLYIHSGKDMPGVSVLSNSGNTITLMLYGSLEGITYETGMRAVRICRANGLGMDVFAIQRFDEYLHGRYTIVFPNGVEVPSLGIVPVNDGYVNSFMLARDVNGNVQLILDTARVLAFIIEETPEAFYVIARNPREVYSMVVVLDPGHGGNDPGAVHHGIYESHLVLDISNKVAYLLSYHEDIKVYMTRHGDTNPSIFWRAEFADAMADILISVHGNAFTNPVIHGIETHYVVSAGEAGLDFNSRYFAEIIQYHKLAATGAHDRGLFRSPQFVVIRQANSIPAVLSEFGFLSNPEEAALLKTVEYQWKIAYGLYNGIIETHRIIGR